MIKTIYFDMDGVLVDFVRSVLTNTEFQEYLLLGHNNPQLHKFLGIKESEFWNRTSYDHWWEWAKPTKYSKAVFNLPFEFFPDADARILTVPQHQQSCYYGKVEWVKRNLALDANSVVFTEEKWRLANPESLLIDDSPTQVSNFRKRGGHAILFPSLCNRLHNYEPNPLPYLEAAIDQIENLFINNQ